LLRSKRGRAGGAGKYSLDALVEDAAGDEAEAAARARRAANATAARAAAHAAAFSDGDSDDDVFGAAPDETALVRPPAAALPATACVFARRVWFRCASRCAAR
jgi:hypothetical protein